MEAKKLIGKLAIRTKPIILGRNNFTGKECYDFSYTTSPIRILKVTENHILMTSKSIGDEKIFVEDIHILDRRWVDDNWEDYEELIKI